MQSILDPCAGGNSAPVEWEYKPGQKLLVPVTAPSYPSVLPEFFGRFRRLRTPGPPLELITMDIREDAPVQYHASYLAGIIAPMVDLVISNPPFVLALEFIQRALDDVRFGGWVVMLLRLNFFGSQKRKPFFDAHMPERVYIHNQRMSFTPDGKADSVEYMHAVWRKGHHPRAALTRVI